MKYWLLILLLLNLNNFSQKCDELKILHVNDMHGKIDKMPYFATIVKKIRKENKNTLLVSAGDIFSGNPIVDKFSEKGYPIIHLMNEIGFDLSTLGNHEFDFGYNVLNKRIKELKHTVLVANITKYPNEFDKLEPYKVIEIGRVPVIFLGLTNVGKNGYPDTHYDNVKDFKFENAEETIKKYEKILKKYPIRIIISHCGYEIDSVLAVKYPFITAIVGGHSHKVINGTKKINGVVIAQAGHYLNFVGILTLKFNKNKVISISDTILSLDKNIEKDTLIESIVNSYNNNPEFSQLLMHFKSEISDENMIGTFMAYCYKNFLKTDFAIQNSGGVRVNKIDTGKFTLKNLFELDPFSNELYVCTLTISTLKDIITFGYHKEGKLDIFSAGFNSLVYLDENKKIVKIDILDENNNLLLDNERFSVAIGSYLISNYCKGCKENCKKSNYNTTQAIKQFLMENEFDKISWYFKKSSNYVFK